MYEMLPFVLDVPVQSPVALQINSQEIIIFGGYNNEISKIALVNFSRFGHCDRDERRFRREEEAAAAGEQGMEHLPAVFRERVVFHLHDRGGGE
jgi:hypothetical protein